jgi:preprotein translocase subunit SecE
MNSNDTTNLILAVLLILFAASALYLIDQLIRSLL